MSTPPPGIPPDAVPAFRICFRSERDYLNAYIADFDSMDGATLLGSVLLVPLNKNRARFEQFQKLIADIVNDTCEVAVGARPFMAGEGVPAPEHERQMNPPEHTGPFGRSGDPDQRFEAFALGLVALCQHHGVVMTTSAEGIVVNRPGPIASPLVNALAAAPDILSSETPTGGTA